MTNGKFSFLVMNAETGDDIRAQAVAFATLAQFHDDHPVWDAVIALLRPTVRPRKDLAMPAEAMPAETDPPVPHIETATTEKRTRRTKAEIEAARAAAEAETPAQPEGPSLQDALEVLAQGEIEAPPVDRADLENQVRVRARIGAEGAVWLREHIMCGTKYTRLTDVPLDIVQRALAV